MTVVDGRLLWVRFQVGTGLSALPPFPRLTIQPIEIVLPGHFVLVVGLRRHPSTGIPKERVGEGRPSAAGPRRVTSVGA